MDNLKMQEIQKKLIDFQVNLTETLTSSDGSLRAIMNGKLEITDIQFTEKQNLAESIPVLKEVINALIKKVSVKIQENLRSISSQYQ